MRLLTHNLLLCNVKVCSHAQQQLQQNSSSLTPCGETHTHLLLSPLHCHTRTHRLVLKQQTAEQTDQLAFH